MITSTIFWTFGDVERCVRTPPNVSFNITQDTSWLSIGHFPITLVVLGPNDVCRQDSSGTVGRSLVCADDAQQLLLFTVVTAVVAGSTLGFFTVSLSLSVGARCLPAGSFRVKAWPRRRLPALSLSKENHHGCMTHHPLGVTRVLVQVHPAPSSGASDL